MSPERPSFNPDAEKNSEQTPNRLRKGAEFFLNATLNKFEVEGKEQLLEYREEHPDDKLIIVSSHISNLDAPAAISALGEDFNVHPAIDGALRELPIHKQMLKAAGSDNFTYLDFEKRGDKHRAKFDPRNFDELSEVLESGKTPWIAAHYFALQKQEMQTAGMGAVYLAHKADAKLVPTALEVEGGSVSFEGFTEQLKGVIGKLTNKNKATYRIGQPMELPKLNIEIIERVLTKRANKEEVTAEERQEFSSVHQALKEQAAELARTIAQMLPERQRGQYS